MKLGKWDLDAFTTSYLETALWSSTDESRDDGGDPLDSTYSPIDFSDKSMVEAIADCKNFRAYVKAMGITEDIDNAQGGHDFWLTRNRHGAGFWDGDYEQGEELTEAAHTFGEVNLYADNGKVHS